MQISVNNDKETKAATLKLLTLAGFVVQGGGGDMKEGVILIDSKQRLPTLTIAFKDANSLMADLQSESTDVGFVKQYDIVEAVGYNIYNKIRLLQNFASCALPLILAKREDLSESFDEDDRDNLVDYAIGTTNPRYLSGWANKIYGLSPCIVPITREEISAYGANIMKAKKVDLLAFALKDQSCNDLGLTYQQTISGGGMCLFASQNKTLTNEVMFLAERLIMAEGDEMIREGNVRRPSYLPLLQDGRSFN
jgi:hypothetical protein